MPSKIGLISSMKKLHLHENRIAALPREIARLTSLQEFSLEWFMYTKPANSRMQKSPEVIKSVCDFCRSFQIRSQPVQRKNSYRQVNTSKHQSNLSEEVTFSDFIIYFHKLSHENLSVKDVTFTMKRRSLVQHLCSNLHYHLLKNLLNSKLTLDLN